MPEQTPLTNENQTCWVDIDLAALRRNFQLIRRIIPKDMPVLAVVKANAYGHGAVEVSRILMEEGADLLGVATVEEGKELRRCGIGGRVLIMGRMVGAEADQALRWHLELTVPHMSLAEDISEAAQRRGTTVKVHLKTDTGMTRLGVPWQEAAESAARIQDLPGLDLVGVYTHFANADLADTGVTDTQIQRFQEVRRALAEAGLDEGLCHMANSAAILTARSPEDIGVRPGIMIYGSSPSASLLREEMAPILTWRCRVIQVKTVPEGTGISYGHDFVTRQATTVATISVGYADGYPRSLTNRGRVLIRGQRAPVLGRVTMDMTMVDVTDIDGVKPGDEVVIIGRQGEAAITADEVAEQAGTINYEIYCGISQRVPRFYHDNGE